MYILVLTASRHEQIRFFEQKAEPPNLRLIPVINTAAASLTMGIHRMMDRLGLLMLSLLLQELHCFIREIGKYAINAGLIIDCIK